MPDAAASRLSHVQTGEQDKGAKPNTSKRKRPSMGRWPALGPLSRDKHDEILAPWARGLGYLRCGRVDHTRWRIKDQSREGTSGPMECESGGPASL
eukprot:scaffold18622_cov137-Isochrysis_galbana.AAC.2